MSPVRIALVDHETLLRQSLSVCLQSAADYQVLWSTERPREAIELYLNQAPDVLLLDLDAHVREACDLVRRIAGRAPIARVIVLSHNAGDTAVRQALALPTRGYILKGDPLESLVTGIGRVMDGDVYLSESIRQRFAAGPVLCPPLPRRLTAHQIEIVRHLARGASAKEIASLMHLSVKTISTHRYRIMHQLGIHDRVQLAHYAIREGLVTP